VEAAPETPAIQVQQACAETVAVAEQQEILAALEILAQVVAVVGAEVVVGQLLLIQGFLRSGT
jgi:hypothetical protein